MKIYLIQTFFAILLLTPFVTFAQFSPLVDIDYPQRGANSVKTFDIDGDGDLDILAVSSDDNKIAWYENINGIFSDQKIIWDQSATAYDCTAFDVDGDLDLDIVLISGTKVEWCENLGLGEFDGSVQLIGTLSGGKAIHSADMDNDGDEDILTANASQIRFIQNLGGGNFASAILISSIAISARCVTTEDLDGDGDLDVLSASHDDDKIAWYENFGGASFGPEQILTLSADGARNVTTADVDSDGDPDILGASFFDDKIILFENLGNGVFGPDQIISNAVDGAMIVAANDIDNDGDLDLMAGGWQNNTIFLYENTAGGVYLTPVAIENKCLQCTDIALSDLNQDGLPELIWASYELGKIAYNTNLGGNQFANQTSVASISKYVSYLLTIDVDNDGDQDLFSTSTDGLNLAVNRGDGTFNPQQLLIGTTSNVRELHAADIDSDGDDDILYVLPVPNQVVWLENNGGGNFGPENIITSDVIGVRSAYPKDIDNDGDLDVFSASSGDDKIAWYENIGGGIFGPQQLIPGNWDGASKIVSFDVDNDGWNDVVATSQDNPLFQNWVSWAQNLGFGNFGIEQAVATLLYDINDLKFGDLNLDGWMDVVIARPDNGDILCYENDGNGGFTSVYQISNLTENVFQIDLFDFDLDGDLDIVSGSNNDNKLAWYENLGGTFSSQNIITISTTPGPVLATDLDNDEDIDIVIGNWNVFLKRWVANYKFHKAQAKGKVFIDMDQNGQLDMTDVGITNIQVFSSPQSNYSYTYSNGDYIINFEDSAGAYIVTYNPLPYWNLTTDSLSYQIEIDTTFNSFDSLNFGFYPALVFDSLSTNLIGSPALCNTYGNLWIDVQNAGTTISSGIIQLHLHDSLTYFSSQIVPDSIVGQDLYWSFDNLFYFTNIQWYVQVENPDFNSMGDTVTNYIVVSTMDSAGVFTGTFSDSLLQIVTCAYDPNDKIGDPFGVDSLGYIPVGTQFIDYTIRFQNTGNDTASIVKLVDQLDPGLDWLSLNPISSSHEYSLDVNQFGEATFLFNNINLPDSSTNEAESKGYVKYRINLLPNLPSGTQINNFAEIYFDFNPPVITNTKIYTLYDCTNELLANVSTIDTSICHNTLLTYNVDIPGTNYVWSIDGFANGDSSVINWMADTSGVFTLNINASNQFCSKYTSLQIEVFQEIDLVINDSLAICPGDSVMVYGLFQSTGGNYYDTLQNVNGCDSVNVTILTIPPPLPIQINDYIEICAGDSIMIYNAFENISGFYYDTLQSLNGCDSIVGTSLVVNPEFPPLVNDSLTICSGEIVLIYDTFVGAAGNYFDTVQSIHGCDSILGTNLALIPEIPIQIIDSLTICSGDSALVFSTYESQQGMYYDSLSSIFGCDSIVAKYLTLDATPAVFVISTTDEANGNDGAIDVQILSADPFSVSWSNGATSDDISGLSGGVYVITVTDSITGCQTIDSITVNSQLGLHENVAHAIQVFPNPNDGHFEVKADNFIIEQIRIVDNMGRAVGLFANIDDTSYQLNVDYLKSGMYQLFIETENATTVRNVIIQ